MLATSHTMFESERQMHVKRSIVTKTSHLHPITPLNTPLYHPLPPTCSFSFRPPLFSTKNGMRMEPFMTNKGIECGWNCSRLKIQRMEWNRM